MMDDPRFPDVHAAVEAGRQAAERAAGFGREAARAAADRVHTPGGFPRAVQLVLGLSIVAAGLLFTLDNLHILRAREYLQYWPISLVVIGIAQMLEGRTDRRFLVGGLWILIGSAMLARRLGLTDVNIWAYWPLVFVVIGYRLVKQAFWAPADRKGTWIDQRRATISNDSIVSGIAVMGGFGRRVTSQTFQRAELTAFMGGGKVDLREAQLAGEEAIIDVFSIMGGFEILVPDTWKVIVEVMPFMGGYDDKTKQHTTESAPRLILRGFVMMGGIEIKN
jgi:predicted membrane protein